MAKSDRGGDRSPVRLRTPDLHDDGDKTGVTAHAMDRYRQRADTPDLAAILRAWALAGPVPPESIGAQAEAVRYDPRTDLLMIVRGGALVTVETPTEWQRAVLDERGWSE
jgi:hypothetical protein